MFASTLDARALLKLAFEAAGANKPSHTYTEKTTERDPKRRSVVFQVHPKFADEVIHQARDFFSEAKFTKSIPKLYTTVDFYGYQTTYIRVIAYKD
jgi:hypothetical protein